MFRPERASRIAASCAALHNFAIHNRLELGEEYDRGILDQIRNEEEVRGNHGRWCKGTTCSTYIYKAKLNTKYIFMKLEKLHN